MAVVGQIGIAGTVTVSVILQEAMSAPQALEVVAKNAKVYEPTYPESVEYMVISPVLGFIVTTLGNGEVLSLSVPLYS